MVWGAVALLEYRVIRANSKRRPLTQDEINEVADAFRRGRQQVEMMEADTQVKVMKLKNYLKTSSF